MKILKFQKSLFVFVLFAGGLPGAPGLPDLAAFDFKEIQTRSGTLYREIEILSSDEHGLLFRHASGIAKLPFSELPAPLDTDYGNDAAAQADAAAIAEDELAGLPGEGFPGAHGTPAQKGAEGEAAVGHSAFPAFHLTARSRVEIPLASPWSHACAPCAHWCQTPWLGAPAPWPSHWPRRPLPHFTGFHPSPPCREAALRNLLIASGLAHPAAFR